MIHSLPRGLIWSAMLLFVPVLVLVLSTASTMAPPPPHLDILSANIVELPPIDASAVPAREVLLSLTVAGPPTCNAGTGYLVYGFLMDSDKITTTGLSGPPFAPLGVDAQAMVVCNPGAGVFTTPHGTVTIDTNPGSGETTVSIRTVVANMPSLDLNWIAFAQGGTSLFRLPAEPESSSWAISEIRLW